MFHTYMLHTTCMVCISSTNNGCSSKYAAKDSPPRNPSTWSTSLLLRKHSRNDTGVTLNMLVKSSGKKLCKSSQWLGQRTMVVTLFHLVHPWFGVNLHKTSGAPHLLIFLKTDFKLFYLIFKHVNLVLCLVLTLYYYRGFIVS